MNFRSFGSAGLKSEKCFKISKVAKGEGLLLLLGSEDSGGYPCISHLGMYRAPWRVWFFHPVCSEADVDFAHFGLESGTVFERGTQQRFSLKFIENTF